MRQPRSIRARRLLKTATLVTAVWLAAGAPIHVGMLTIPTP